MFVTDLVRKRILAELADEHDFIDFLHDHAVGFLGYLENLIAARACRFDVFPVCNTLVAIKLIAALCFRDGFLENAKTDWTFEIFVKGLVLCHVLREDE